MKSESIQPFQMPFFEAQLMRVIDGDTLDVLIDVGFDCHVRARVRLANIDTPEMRGPEREAGKVAARYVRDRLGPHPRLIVHSRRGGERGSFNRWLAVVYFEDGLGSSTWVDLNQELLDKGLAEHWRKK